MSEITKIIIMLHIALGGVALVQQLAMVYLI